ncbi:MAG TPA: S8 family serine peptidase [Acidimicrobiales bacterium]|nr:S8 family serine peptidase [Acidimicrobiales bacterium]
MHRTRRSLIAALAVALAATAAPAFADLPLLEADPVAAEATPGLDRLLASTTDATTAIATLDAVPTSAVGDALAALGLEVQLMEHLPLALVRGPVTAMEAAVATGIADDVYPDEQLQWFDTASSDAMGAAAVRKAGLTGEGVTVAVVDSGCDASHPDLADHVTHNVKVVSPEYANGRVDSHNTIAVPIEEGPYQNTDLGSGHGTHVAGIIAADGTTSPDHLGVAPDAELVCIGVGEVLFTTAVVTAYDHLLDQPDMWGVDVINNSWGNSYAQFDPRNPVAVATKATADNGALVVFAAGNSGDGEGEGTLNPFSQAPWVVSVAAETVDHVRGSFSSNGFRFDNSDGVTIGPEGHTIFTDRRVGLVHPDVAAPGVDISSSCDTAGAAVGPCAPGENTTASGTSMASPHVAGAAAVLLEANPALTPRQLQAAMQVTARPVATEEGGQAPFWQVGYGRVDLARAVELVRSPAELKKLDGLQAKRDAALIQAAAVVRSDFWTYDAPRATYGTDARTYTINPQPGVDIVRATIVHPSEAVLGADLGLFEYSVTIEDAKGNVLATHEQVGIGAQSAKVDLAGLTAAQRAELTVRIVGTRALSDPDTLDSDSLLNDTVTLQVVQRDVR